MFKSEYDEIKANLIKKSLEKDKTDVYIPVERRKGNDFRLNFINFMCFFMWATLFVVIAVLEKASKSIREISQSDFLWLISKFWETDLVEFAFIITIISIIVCFICIILSLTRHRRRSDKIKKSLIMCQIIYSIIGIFLVFKII